MKFLPSLLLGSALLLNGCGIPVDPERVLVTVNGTPIREKQVLAEADIRINEDAARSANMGLIYDESGRDTTRAVLRDDVLHTLIERRLIADQLKADHIEISDAEVDSCFLARAKEHGQTPEEAEQEIQYQGKTLRDVKERIRWNTLGVQKLYDVHARNKKDLTEAEALQFYTESPAEFRQQEERRVSRILINAPPDAADSAKKSARARADDLLKRIKAGEDFAVLARTYSEDVTTSSRGGDRGWSGRGHVTAPGNDPFGDAAFALKNIGDVSEVVETLDGYEIIKLTGLKEARQKSFDEIKTFIIERDKHWEIGNFWDQFADDLRKNARIEWDPQELARRAAKEKRDREYNEKMAKQVARDQAAREGSAAVAIPTEAPGAGSPNPEPK